MRDGLLVLIADDEAPARQRLADLLRLDRDVGRIVEAGDGRLTLQAIANDPPDLLFLDIQMPELTGLELIESIGASRMPLTVFVTAYDRHAVRAFEANALDYLLKPFSDERMEATLARAKTRLSDERTRAPASDAPRLLSNRAAGPTRDRIVVRSAGTTRLVRHHDIDWIEGAGVYVNLHVGGKALLHRASLTELVDLLDPTRFVRIHRSAIVNIDRIEHLEAATHGEFDVVLKNGSRTRISRTYRAALEQRLGQSL